MFSRPQWILTLASLLVAHWLRMVSRVAFLAIVAMSAGRVVVTVDTDAAASFARQTI